MHHTQARQTTPGTDNNFVAGYCAPCTNRGVQNGNGTVPKQLQPGSVWPGHQPGLTGGTHHLLPSGGGSLQSFQQTFR